MLDEKALRRPSFREGTAVVLGDGGEWHFPKPWLRIYPTRAGEVRGGISFGKGYEERIDELLECDPDDTFAQMTVQLKMAADLLCQNYELDDAALETLLAVDTNESAWAERWGAVCDALLCRPPKPSPGGSATPA